MASTWVERCPAVHTATGGACALHLGHLGAHQVPAPRAAEAVVIRAYHSKDLKGATKAYERDAIDLAKQGFLPIAQTWAPERITIGSPMFGPRRPKGTLTVTYRGPAPLQRP